MNMLEGGGTGISYHDREKAGDPFPNSGTFRPLKLLSKIENVDTATVVLSVGGNDIRENLGRIAQGRVSGEETLKITVKNYLETLKK
eukprot:UN34566